MFKFFKKSKKQKDNVCNHDFTEKSELYYTILFSNWKYNIDVKYKKYCPNCGYSREVVVDTFSVNSYSALEDICDKLEEIGVISEKDMKLNRIKNIQNNI